MSSWLWGESTPADPSQTWVAKQTAVLATVKRTAEGEIDTASYLAAVARVEDVYDALFPGMWPVSTTVRNLLKADISNGVSVVRAAMEAAGAHGATLRGLVQWQLETLGIEQCRTDKVNATKSLLWLNRACTFMAVLLRSLIAASVADTASAVSTAYSQVLKPYHTDATVFIVGNAMSLAPGREGILTALQLTTEELAQKQLGDLLPLMEPLIAGISKMLEELGCNFPDKM